MVGVIIQARVNSSRFYGKVLKDLCGKPLISHVIDRVKKCQKVDKIILATGQDKCNLPLQDIAINSGIGFFVGSDNDVLDRYYRCAVQYGLYTIVRITGDCPVIDSKIIDNMIEAYDNDNYKTRSCDYLSNIHPPTYPDGMDVEVFSFNSLEDAYDNARKEEDREHVTPYIWHRKLEYFCKNIENDTDYSKIRLTVDTPEDLEFIKELMKYSSCESMKDIIDVINTHPELSDINNSHQRNENCQNVYVDDSYLANKYRTSNELLEISKKIIPNASQTYSKSYRYFPVGASPLFLDRGNGSKVWDVDGNEYIDFICALGAITLGHNNQTINDAITQQLSKGTSFSCPTALEVDVAQELISHIPSAEMVKFLKNGSDATTACVRLARAFTKRDIVACCGYHGYHDWYIGSTVNNNGVPKSVSTLTEKFVYNDIKSLNSIFLKYPNRVAAVILEPCQLDGPESDFLNEVKKITHMNDSVLIFDEVISGFRMGLGGAQYYYGVTPDLSAFGKGIANGMPLSVVVGKSEIMKLIDEDVFISTTFGGETLSLAAAFANIKEFKEKKVSKYLLEIGNNWLSNMNSIIKQAGVKDIVRTGGVSPYCTLVFSPKDKNKIVTLFQQEMINNGILTLGVVNNFSFSHTIEDLNKYYAAATKAFDKIKRYTENDADVKIEGDIINPIFERNKYTFVDNCEIAEES